MTGRIESVSDALQELVAVATRESVGKENGILNAIEVLIQ
jgi:hypothetical protein